MPGDSPAPNPVAALEQIRERNEAAIRHRALTEATVATLPEGDVRLLLKVVEAVLKLHAEFRVYDECGHEHTQDEVDAGTAVVLHEEGAVTCEDGYVHSVCRACCTGGWSQTEACASDHERPCWPCGTVEAIAGELPGKETADAT